MPLPLTVLTAEQTGTMSGAAVRMPAASASSAIVRAVDMTPEDAEKCWPYGWWGVAPRLAGALPERIRRIAICPGSGSSLAPEAAACGADLLITTR